MRGADRHGGAAASVRARTTLAATLVVAVALVLGAFAFVALVRDSLHDGVESTAEQQVAAIRDQIATSGLPAQPRTEADDDDDPGEGDEPDEEVWQVSERSGDVVRRSQALARPLPRVDDEDVRLPGADDPYLVLTESVGTYDVTVAVSLEEVGDSTRALVPPLLVGLPLLLLLVAGTTWVVAARALAPVERIRREVDHITGDQLERRVPEPSSRDEVHRLATTMNRMLVRLQESSSRQQQFVADASHELRSPLASLRQTAEVARAHPGALPEGELATAVLEEGMRMQRLVDQLLLLTRADEGAVAGDPREVDLDDVVLDAARRLRSTGTSVDVSQVGPARVRADELALTQVVRNLADNAARHATSQVRLAVREVPEGAEVVVEDDGPGVPPDERTRVFERFVRLDEARARDGGGSGLGLAIVAEIVRAHRGSVEVTRAATGGARFVVRLPRGGDRST